MDQILQGIQGVFCYLDDIIVTGSTMEEHHERLVAVFKRLAPLHRLLQKDVKWSWGAAEEVSFLVVKEMLLRDRVLMRYDPDLPLVLATDSSSYGLGAVLSHRTPEGVELPIAYAS